MEHCLSGYNSSVFAYGQTASGKTYTIAGDLEHRAGQEGQARYHVSVCLCTAFQWRMQSCVEPCLADVQMGPDAGLALRMYAHIFERIREEEGSAQVKHA